IRFLLQNVLLALKLIIEIVQVKLQDIAAIFEALNLLPGLGKLLTPVRLSAGGRLVRLLIRVGRRVGLRTLSSAFGSGGRLAAAWGRGGGLGRFGAGRRFKRL